MAVVKNLMVRIGADYSGAKKSMQGASRELGRFKNDTTRATSVINGKKGLGGITAEFKNLTSTVTESFSRIRGAKGIGGVVGEVRTLTPALRSSATAMTGLGAATLTTSARFGIAGIAAGALVGVLGLLAVGLHKASQPAVRFEADLGRLNMQLKGGARAYMLWATAQGLAKTSAAQFGATYSVLLSAFTKDNKQLQSQTKQLVQTTRVVASATGRTIEDTMQRIRSGLLGNTEAVEDLGIFVNVSMIESTKAFRKFAGDKSWDQLDFRVQQQIRLAAILEQAYDRYGDKLQDNVMTKQELLMEQLKDIKLNWSQAFLPIWDSVLPALTALAEDLAFVTEKIARFSYWLRGWDYDEATSGSNQQADAVSNLGDRYEKTGKQAAKARKELASFDQLNLLGSGSSGGSGPSGSGGSSGGDGNNSTGGGGSGSGGLNLPELPKPQLVFLPPAPPDAGMGAVATAVTETMNSMNAQVKQRISQMWGDMQAQTQAGAIGQQAEWGRMWNGIGEQTSLGSSLVRSGTKGMYSELQKTSAATTGEVSLDWRTMLGDMLISIVTQRPRIMGEWEKLKISVTSIKKPLTIAKEEWKGALSYMQQQLNAYRPYLEWGWHLIGVSVKELKSPLADVKESWSDTLSDMYTTAASKLGGVLDEISSVSTAWSNMKQVLSGESIRSSAVSSPRVTAPENGSIVTEPSGQSHMDMLKQMFGTETLSNIWDRIKQESGKKQNQIAASIFSTILPAGKLTPFLRGAGSAVDDIIKSLAKMFKGGGNAIPAFAGGGLVFGPTLAMVGDNRNASSDPEVIAPLSDLEDIMGGGDDAETVAVLRAILQAVKENRTVQAVISRDAVGRASTEYIRDETKRGRNPLPTP